MEPAVASPVFDLCASASSADHSSSSSEERAARIRLALEALTSLRAAQAPCEGEGEIDSVDHAAIGAAIRAFAAVLAGLAPGLAFTP